MKKVALASEATAAVSVISKHRARATGFVAEPRQHEVEEILVVDRRAGEIHGQRVAARLPWRTQFSSSAMARSTTQRSTMTMTL